MDTHIPTEFCYFYNRYIYSDLMKWTCKLWCFAKLFIKCCRYSLSSVKRAFSFPCSQHERSLSFLFFHNIIFCRQRTLYFSPFPTFKSFVVFFPLPELFFLFLLCKGECFRVIFWSCIFIVILIRDVRRLPILLWWNCKNTLFSRLVFFFF